MKARTLIIIFATLVIGFFLGILTSAQIRYQKLKPVRTFFSEEMFRKNIFGTIQPEEQQKAKIDEIIGKYAVLNMNIQTDFRNKFEIMMKDFWSEIEPNLTKEQLSRLKEMEDRRVEMFNRDPDDRLPMDSNNFRNNRNTPSGFNDTSRFGLRTPDKYPVQKREDHNDSLMRPVRPFTGPEGLRNNK
jgi:hypothetical protein